MLPIRCDGEAGDVDCVDHETEQALVTVSSPLAGTPHFLILSLAGDLSVCYDSLGQLYQVPRYCYSNPSNLVSDEEAGQWQSAARLLVAAFSD